MTLYLTLIIASGFIPLLLSFDKKLHFYTRWKYVFPTILFVALFYIIPDIYLTHLGIWGFNSMYHSGITVLGLPLEEFLFFIVIPYASIFLHYSLMLYWPFIRFKKSITHILATIFTLLVIVMLVFNLSKIYTSYAFVLFILAMLLGIADKRNTLGGFMATFLLIMIPFIIVDGILTGTCISQEIVWYNNDEILGIRIFTIPVEDFLYGFSLIFFNVFIIETVSNFKFFRLNQPND